MNYQFKNFHFLHLKFILHIGYIHIPNQLLYTIWATGPNLCNKFLMLHCQEKDKVPVICLCSCLVYNATVMFNCTCTCIINHYLTIETPNFKKT